MAWEFENNRPIYTQLLDKIQMMIISGKYKPGDRFTAVRELSVEAGVNPNTMQRALQELERIGLVSSNRTSGRLVTEDTDLIERIKEQKASEYTQVYLNNMRALGIGTEKILQMVTNEAKKKDT